ncbi:MAG: MBL fold metallo-hydrolase [Reichenbachiella sp.]
MEITFYGTRGSHPTSSEKTLKFGGDTTCILLTTENQANLILDAGTGIINLGNDIINTGRQKELIILMSHFHWDHIQGLPFFAPLFSPDYKISFIALNPKISGSKMESIFKSQMSSSHSSRPYKDIKAKVTYLDHTWLSKIKGLTIDTVALNHPGENYGVRLIENGKSVVFMIDHEHKGGIIGRYVHFCEKVDVLVHDAQFTDLEMETSIGMGHSTYSQSLTLAEKSGAKQLIFTHHNPMHDDKVLTEINLDCKKRMSNSCIATKKMTWQV